MKKQFKSLCGEVMTIYYDDKIKEMNLQLVNHPTKGMNIQIMDWTGDKDEVLVNLHIKEAIKLKSIIDCLVYDALERGKE